MALRKYGKGEKTLFSTSQEVTVDVDVDLSIQEIIECIKDDEEALDAMKRELLGKTDLPNSLGDKVYDLAFKVQYLSLEDEQILKDIIAKYETYD